MLSNFYKLTNINNISSVKTMNKISLYNPTYMKSINSLSLVKTVIVLSIIKAQIGRKLN
jgi:hypothetical protein